MKKLILILILFSCSDAEEITPDIAGTYVGTKDLAGTVIQVDTGAITVFGDELVYSIKGNEIVAYGAVSGAHKDGCEYMLDLRLTYSTDKLSGTWQNFFKCFPDNEYIPPLNVEFIKQ